MGSCLKIKKEIQVINKSSIRYGDIETFFPLEHILVWRYWKILNLKSIKILNYIKPLCIIFILNWFKHFDQKTQITFVQKCFNTLIFYNTNAHTLLQPLNKNWTISFFTSSDMQKFHHLLGCHPTGINSSLFYLSSLRFQNLICQARSLTKIRRD